MDKKSIIGAIVARLRLELEARFNAAVSARNEATHEQSRAENKYDTRGLEASYLARGQSRQAAEFDAAIRAFEELPARNLDSGSPIQVGAYVVLELGREQLNYFVGPKAGGTEVTVAGREILVITPQSPLGQQLIGRVEGARLRLDLGGRADSYRVVSVS